MFFSFFGYIRVKITGDNVAYFINICSKNGLQLRNVKKVMNVYYADVKSKHYKLFSSLCDDYYMDVEVCGKFGFLMKLILYKSRKAFFAVVMLLSLYYGINSCFISEIVISGNNIFPDSQILSCLSENGVYPGRLKFGIDPEIFQNEVIMDFPQLSWIWVEIDGTKAIVEVREKVSKPPIFDYSLTCNVVASKDGVITSAIASAGTLLVKEGMYVRKGDILINGVYDSTDFAPVRFVNAGGKVYAKTHYTLEDTFGLNYVSYTQSDDIKTKITPKLSGINFYDTDPLAQSQIVVGKKDMKFKLFGKNYFPLAFTKTKYCEIIRKEYTLSPTEAQNYAIKELTRRLSLSLPEGASVTNTQKNIIPNPDGSFKASVSFDCIEDIATKAYIEVETD